MVTGLPALSHEQQQAAVERIQQLIAEGMSSGQAIAQVAQEIRETHQGEHIAARFDEDDE
ncbi:YoaH family protein [Enterobacteriaceae bacterium LUAb1]